MNDQENDLKPCPFCGGEATLELYPGCTIAKCERCNISMSDNDAPMANESEPPYHQEVIKGWNYRHRENDMEDALDKAKEGLEFYYNGGHFSKNRGYCIEDEGITAEIALEKIKEVFDD